ncbi:MAG: bifunctional oligoribonuclease/PAP phosphatase NrnA [Ruminococcaceae bacterium]|nr:bifunctional oligoribonuclease/PAP phosphatase NrnA [Oscillospiraceae bacterium]
MFEQLIEAIKKYDRIIIHRHSNPDGDALGSQIGLKNIIKENFPGKEVYAVGDSSVRFGFMEDSKTDDIPDEYYNGALAIVLDTSATALISDARYATAELTACVDHHIFCEKFTDIEIRNTTYESCCGLIAEFAIECSLKLNSLAAKSLYTGMVTDSGRFRYDSTNSNTFRLASFLMEQKFDTNDIYANLYADDFSYIRLRAQFVLKINFTEKNVAYIYTTKDELASYNVDTFSISRGMVSTMSDIRGVDVWVNFTETDAGVLCEIRSSKYNINPIAVKYGGGGHAKASGATLKNRDEAMSMLADLNAITEV